MLYHAESRPHFLKDRLLRAMTGLNRKAFELLLPSFAEAYEQSRVNPEVERKRAVGGGRKATLRTSREKLFYILLVLQMLSHV